MKVTNLVLGTQPYQGFDLQVKTPPPPANIKYAIVRIPVATDPAPFPNTVMAAAVNDQDIPTKIAKGATIPCRPFFDIMSMIQSAQALRWAIEPHVLWINKRYLGDSAWPDPDPQGNPPDAGEPVAECIYYPLNFVAYDNRMGDWFRLLSYKNTEPPTDPYTDNWITKPYLWGKAQALSKDGLRVTNVGAELDVYLPLIKKTAHTWMHLNQLELLPELPFVLMDGTIIISYKLSGADVIGITQSGAYIYLRKTGKFTGTIEPYNWHLQTRAVIPPEGF